MAKQDAKRFEVGSLTFAAPLAGAAMAAEAEAMGYDFQFFGVNDCQTTDVFTELRMAAEATEQIGLGTCVANFVTRHPVVVASGIAAVQVASGGRAICGVGKGDSAVGRVGRSPQRHEDFVHDLRALCAYLSGGSIELHGVESRLAWLGETDYRPVPVEVAATGPRSLAAAGAHADRVSLAVGADEGRIRWALEIVRSAAKEAGRPADAVRIGAHIPLHVDDDRARAIEALRPSTVGWAHMASFSPAHVASHEPILKKVTSVVHALYDYEHHGYQESNTSPVRHLADDEFVDYYGIAGPADYALERLGKLAGLGLEFFTFVAEGEQKRRIAADIIPALHAARSG